MISMRICIEIDYLINDRPHSFLTSYVALTYSYILDAFS